jgi:hypothetical protein
LEDHAQFRSASFLSARWQPCVRLSSRRITPTRARHPRRRRPHIEALAIPAEAAAAQIDGNLTEDFWAHAAIVKSFLSATQVKASPRRMTELRVAFDRAACSGDSRERART